MIKKLKIGYLTYKVKLTPDISETHWGKCNTQNQTLMISHELSKEFTAENVLHEALHASWKNMNQQAPTDTEELDEYCVRFASKAMCLLLSQNPKLIDYLKENLS